VSFDDLTMHDRLQPRRRRLAVWRAWWVSLPARAWWRTPPCRSPIWTWFVKSWRPSLRTVTDHCSSGPPPEEKEPGPAVQAAPSSCAAERVCGAGRLAWHAAGSYDKNSKTGGSNGASACNPQCPLRPDAGHRLIHAWRVSLAPFAGCAPLGSERRRRRVGAGGGVVWAAMRFSPESDIGANAGLDVARSLLVCSLAPLQPSHDHPRLCDARPC
jgi:hypothetical protein